MNRPRVSVGLPVCNGENYLDAAVRSILSQDYEDFELVISDNASTDRTQEICLDFARQDPRVKYSRLAANCGAVSNFQRVFRLSTGDYFKWAAHDDVCTPDFLERCVAVLERDPAVVLCCGQTQLINDDGSPVRYDPGQKCYVTRHGERVGQHLGAG